MIKKILLVLCFVFSQIFTFAKTQQQKSVAKIIDFKTSFKNIKTFILVDESDFIKIYPISFETNVLNKNVEQEKAENLKPVNEIITEASKIICGH